MGHVRPKEGCYRKGNDKEYPTVTARKISESIDFLIACEKVGSKPSVRQARDYRRRIGKYNNV